MFHVSRFPQAKPLKIITKLWENNNDVYRKHFVSQKNFDYLYRANNCFIFEEYQESWLAR